LGTYTIEAKNPHGHVRTSSTLNIGDPFNLRSQAATPNIEVQEIDGDSDDLMDFDEEVNRGRPEKRPHIHRKGVAPNFVIGLEDMELRAGDTAAVTGKLQPKSERLL
jgi:hypothetical protein